ncbi:MAG: hypothetical protein WD716_00150 [Fimbriimonadaceae bacterium]
MKNLFDKQPISDEAPRGLRNKVEYASRQQPRRAWFAPRYRWAAAGTAVAAAAVAGVMFLVPSSAEAKTWDMVQDAYGKVRGMLIQMRFDDPNGASGEMLIAGKGNDWRVSFKNTGDHGPDNMDISYSPGELTLWDGGDTAQVISLGMNIPFQPEQVMQGMAEQLTASKIFEQHADEMGQRVRVEQPVVVDGRRVYNVYITDPNKAGNQVHVVVDAETDLPISMKMQGERGESMHMSFEFNGEFDRSLLQPVLPSGVKFKHTDIKSMGGEGKDMFRGLEEFGNAMEHTHDDGKPQEDKSEVRIERAVKLG